MWNEVGKKVIREFHLVNPKRLSHEIRMFDDNTTIALITLPTPEAVSEAYFVALVYRPEKNKQSSITRYIFLEYSVPPGYSSLPTVLEEWTVDGKCKNIGYGCEPTVEAFHEAVCNLL